MMQARWNTFNLRRCSALTAQVSALVLDGFLHQLTSNKHHVRTTTAFAKSTLRLRQRLLSNIHETILDDPSKQLANDIQQAYAPPVVSHVQVALLWNGDYLRVPPVGHNCPTLPHSLHQRVNPGVEGTTTTHDQLWGDP